MRETMANELGIWLVRSEAQALGAALQQRLGGDLFSPWQEKNDVSQRERFRRNFSLYRQWVLVMASGIAVRYLDGLLCDKRSDPAVVVLDEAARHAIALVGGHEAGANRLAYRVANAVGATPVIGTAGEALKPLVLGIGCRKGVDAEAIAAAVRLALPCKPQQHCPPRPLGEGWGEGNRFGDRPLDDVREVATVSVKAEEPGLLAFCERYDLPLRVIALEQIADRPWTGQPSAWVRETLGVDGVCEPAALIACPRGRLIVPKTACGGVAVAVVSDREGNAA